MKKEELVQVLRKIKGTAASTRNQVQRKIAQTAPVKKVLEFAAKNANEPQYKPSWEIVKSIFNGEDSFYRQDRKNGSNEIDTYLYGTPYNTVFTGDESLGPDYTNYMQTHYPGITPQTYNTHFGDTLYIDESARPQIEEYIRTGKTAPGSMGRYSGAPSYIISTEDDRPYDAGGMTMKFGLAGDGNVVAHMGDVYDFYPKDFEMYNESDSRDWITKLAVYAMNAAGKPFIVRQNNIPVVFKNILPKYNTQWQYKLGEFLANFGNMYDLSIPLRLTDELIQEIFYSKPELSGDDILNFMADKGYIEKRW